MKLPYANVMRYILPAATLLAILTPDDGDQQAVAPQSPAVAVVRSNASVDNRGAAACLHVFSEPDPYAAALLDRVSQGFQPAHCHEKNADVQPSRLESM